MSVIQPGSFSHLVLHFGNLPRMSPDDFLEFSHRNPLLRMELAANGDLIIQPMVGGTTSLKITTLTCELAIWSKQDGSGTAVGWGAGFLLPNGAVLAPTASWMLKNRWQHLTKEQREKFAPLAPDFVAELRPDSDSLEFLHEKMAEYIANGVRLGWLIDPESKTAWVYRPDVEPQKLDQPESVVGDPVLPGFVLKMGDIWN